MSQNINPEIILVNPTGGKLDSDSLHISPRPNDLRGKRLGLLDNTKANAEVILRRIADILGHDTLLCPYFLIQVSKFLQ